MKTNKAIRDEANWFLYGNLTAVFHGWQRHQVEQLRKKLATADGAQANTLRREIEVWQAMTFSGWIEWMHTFHDGLALDEYEAAIAQAA
jgi:hypothetical protein